MVVQVVGQPTLEMRHELQGFVRTLLTGIKGRTRVADRRWLDQAPAMVGGLAGLCFKSSTRGNAGNGTRDSRRSQTLLARDSCTTTLLATALDTSSTDAVWARGLEPPPPLRDWDLNPARLPISPRPRDRCWYFRSPAGGRHLIVSHDLHGRRRLHGWVSCTSR